jgi:hypothetical protein
MPENIPDQQNADTRFETGQIFLKKTTAELIEQGFQKWPEAPVLTTTAGLTADAKFQTRDVKTPEDAIKEVLAEAERLSGKEEEEWEVRLIVETFDQNQKRAHIFLRLSQ